MATNLLDVHDDADASRSYDVIIASKSVDRPWFGAPSLEETLLDWRHVDKAEQKEIHVVRDSDGGQIVGVATIWMPLEDNTTMAWCDIQVDPDHRRQGHGSTLMERIVERVSEEGRASIVTDFMVPGDSDEHPYRRFAERHDFTLSNTEIMRHLELPVADGLLDRLDAENRPRWEGAYRLETHVGGVPEPLQESLCAVMNQLGVDAPTGDIEFEEESYNPARYQEYLELEEQMKRVRLTTVAIHEESGIVAAYTDLVLPAGAPDRAWQWGTFVHREHRGHRLGMAVKIENLRRLQADHPDREKVVTGNDGTNSYMVSINEELGFRIVELAPAYQRKL